MYIIMNRDRRAFAYGTVGLMESTQRGTSLKRVQTSLEKGGSAPGYPEVCCVAMLERAWGCWGRWEAPPWSAGKGLREAAASAEIELAGQSPFRMPRPHGGSQRKSRSWQDTAFCAGVSWSMYKHGWKSFRVCGSLRGGWFSGWVGCCDTNVCVYFLCVAS